MLSHSLKLLTLNLFLLAGALSLFGQPTNVVDWNHTWRYDQSGALPAANWFATNFNDSAWPSGPGALGFPVGENLLGQTSVNTPLSINDPGGVQVITYYFRTTFVLPTTNGITSITASNLIDDGSVVYLNGREIYRLAMNPGAVTYTNIATRANDISEAGHGMEGRTIALTNFVVGTNYLAVEVHQGSATGSSDAIMAMKVVANFPTPGQAPVITVQPQDQEVDLGQRATFTIGATGTTPLTYRWFSNDVFITATAAGAYTTPILDDLSANSSLWYATVSNRLGIVTSATARLSVLVRGPILTNAVPAAGNRVALSFHEGLIAGGPTTNFNNYEILILGTTNRVAFTNVTVSGAGVQLTLRSGEVLDPNQNYVVCAYDMQDAQSNITAQTCIGIGFATTNTIFGLGGQWDYTFGTAPAANWMQPNYTLEPIWSEEPGFAPFFQDQVFGGNLCGELPGSTPTAISTTYYFRLRFSVPAGTDLTAPVRMQYLVDDGAVFYLNGREFHRYSMPQTPVTHATLASAATEANCNTALTTNLAGLLQIGNNVLAVSVHQVADQGGVENDIIFDTSMRFVFQDRPTIPSLSAIRTLAGAVQIRYTTNAPGWVLESAPNIDGPWSVNTAQMQVITRTNVLQVPPLGTAETNRFFRLRN